MTRIAEMSAMLLVGSLATLETMAAEDLGRALYTNCAACHGAEGQGGFAPPFKNNANLRQADYVIEHILKGSPTMPAFEGALSSEEIAAVSNHIRNSWGNRGRRISAANVEKVEERNRVPTRE